MDKKPIVLYKTLVIGVLILLVCVAFPPSLNADTISKDKSVEVTSEFCCLGRKHSVQLSQEELEELEIFFDTIYLRLDKTESEDETIKIYNEAIREFEGYGLLGDMSFKQVQRLIIGRYHKSKVNFLSLDDNENRNCLIMGKTTETWFESLLTIFSYKITDYTRYILGFIFYAGYIYLSLFSYYNPFSMFYRINFGKCIYEHEMQNVEVYASGWLHTIGKNGEKNWQGKIQGSLPIEGTSLGAVGPRYSVFYPGVVGFTGLKISSDNKEFYLGYARQVQIYCEEV